MYIITSTLPLTPYLDLSLHERHGFNKVDSKGGVRPYLDPSLHEGHSLNKVDFKGGVMKRSRGDAPVAAVAPAPFPLRLSWPLPWWCPWWVRPPRFWFADLKFE